MSTIRVRDVAGRFCITMSEGEALFRVLQPILRRGERAELDFDGVTVYASPFFNAGIGQLLREITKERLRQLIEVRGLSADGNHVLQRTIENAATYYRNEELRRAIDEGLANP